MQVLAALCSNSIHMQVNPVHANAVAGLATSATAQATVQRTLLWSIRNEVSQSQVGAYKQMTDQDEKLDS